MSGIKEKAVSRLGLPKESAMGALRIVVMDGEAYVENHLGISKYTSGEVIIRASGATVTISGQNFVLGHMRKDDIKITGKINNVAIAETQQ